MVESMKASGSSMAEKGAAMNSIRMGTYTLESFLVGRPKAEASTFGLMAKPTRASGIRGENMVTGCGRAPKEIPMSANGKTVSPMVSGSRSLQMATNMRESGDTP